MEPNLIATLRIERAKALVLATAVMTALMIGLLLVATPAYSVDPFVVNSAEDDPDADLGDSPNACDTDLGTPGNQCTLRAAIEEANATDGADIIRFAIQGAGPHTISPSSELPPITETVTINGYSESLDEGTTPASPNTLADGNNAVLKIGLSGAEAPTNTSGLKIKASNSTVKGLVISDWTNTGIFLDEGATGNQVTGNFIGTDTSNTQGLGNNIGVNLTNAPNNTIGGTEAAARNIISGNDGFGVYFTGATGNKVQGNYIGTDKDGDDALANATHGVVIDNASNNTIGGTTAGARNIISGNGFYGIRISFSKADRNRVQGNYIGTDVSGRLPLGNGLNGVSIQNDADRNIIGGATTAAGNIISGNGKSGVEVLFSLSDDGPATGNRILSNSIYNNGDANPANGDEVGIDLYFANNPAGVTPNDPPEDDDGDGGPNNLQNFPDLTSARNGLRATTIRGTLNSSADTTFTIQFFSSPQADPTGFGEGKKFLGQIPSVTTDESGNATFTFKTEKKVRAGQFVTATATNQTTRDTSEFSNAVTVTSSS